jgi:hypothetical protein
LTTQIIFDEVCCSLCGLLHSPATSSSLGTNTFLSFLFSNTTPSAYVPLPMSETKLHTTTTKTTGKIIVLYVLIFIVLDSKLKDKPFCTEYLEFIVNIT